MAMNPMSEKELPITIPNITIDLARSTKGVWSLKSLKITGDTWDEVHARYLQAKSDLNKDFGWV